MMLTIDPGISGTGWALWSGWVLIKTGIITPPDALSWESKMTFVMGALKNIIEHYDFIEVHVELPKQFGGVRGMATSGKGSLTKLTLLVGAIMFNFQAKPVPVNDWKGQLPKEVVEKRVKDILPKCKAKSHAIDAVGIGLYIQGRF